MKYRHNRIAACTNSESEYERNRARNRPVCLREGGGGGGESKRRRDADENISRRSVRSCTHQRQEGKVSARSARRNIPRETPRDRAGKTGR